MTIRDRMPTILTKAIDTIHRNKNKFFEEHGEVRHVYIQLIVNVELKRIAYFKYTRK